MAVTLDTNVLLSATLWDGSVAQKLLFRLLSANEVVCSSPAILQEYQLVLQRDFDYSEEEAAAIVQKLMAFIHLVIPSEKFLVVIEDPSDNIILECAVASSSKIILTYDKHLLKLREFKGIKIIKPEEAINFL